MLASAPVSGRARRRVAATRRPAVTRLLVGAAVAVFGVALAPIQATAAGNAVDPATYVHALCTTISGFTTQVSSLQSSANLSGSTSLADVRDRLASFLTQATTAASSAVTDLQSAGFPDLKNGDRYAALIVKEITSLRDAYGKAAASAQALDTGNAKTFQNQEKAIGKRIDAAGAKVSRVQADAKKRYNIKSLKVLESQDPSCQGLG